MRFGFIALILFAGPALVHAQGQAPTTLADLRGSHRLLLIFAANPQDPQLAIQLRRLQEHAQDVAERDITVIAVPFRTPSPTPVSLTGAEADAARHRFGVAPADFTVILIGKDGGEKLRSRKPLSMQKLNDTIDAMPMRQDEMKTRP